MKVKNSFWLIWFILILSSCQNNLSQKEIKIGTIQQLTGQMAKYGKTHVAAVSAMLETINKERLEKKLPTIKLLTEDDQLQPSKGVSIIQKMITVDKVVAVLGAQGSSVTLAMAPIAEQSQVVLISGASGSPKITEAGDYIFRTCPSDVYEAEFTAKVYESLYKDKPLAIMYINNDYGIGLKDAFLRSLTSKPSVTLDLAFQQGTSDFRNLFTKIRNAKVTVIYLIGYEEMITIYKQAKEFGIKCNWLGNNQLNDQSIIDKMGTTADGTIFPGHKFKIDSIKLKYPEFYKKFLELSGGEELDVFAAYGVDALMVIIDALINGAKTGKEIKDELYKMKEIHGLTGKFSFNEKGDAVRELALYQIKNAKIEKFQ